MESILQSKTELFRQSLERIPDKSKVGLGWLRFTCSTSYLSYWTDRIALYFQADLFSRGKGWNGYQESLTGVYSILLAYTPIWTEAERQEQGIKRSPNEGFMTVDIPQSALETLSVENLFKLLLDFYGCEGAKLTRIDVYYDDFCKIISPQQVHEAVKAGQIAIPRFQRMRGFDDYDLAAGKQEGYTVYFGSTKSDKQVRFYDKFAESKGRLDCYRWEVQAAGKLAEAVQSYLLDALTQATEAPDYEAIGEVFANAYKAIIKGAISFHAVPEGMAISDLSRNWATRTPLTWWWAELLAGLEPAKLTVQRTSPSLESMKNWVTYQVTPALALLRTAFSYWRIPFKAWLDRELERGEERWSDRHFKMLQHAFITSPAT